MAEAAFPFRQLASTRD